MLPPEVVGQVPALVVLAFIVMLFLKNMSGFQEIIKQNTMVLGEVLEALRQQNGKKV